MKSLPFQFLAIACLAAHTLLVGCATPVRAKRASVPPQLIGSTANHLWPGLTAVPETVERHRGEVALLELLLRDDEKHIPTSGSTLKFRDGLEVTVDARDLPWKLSPGDEYTLADRFAFDGLRNHHRRPGTGVPLIADLHHSRVTPGDRHYPLEGRVYPVTAVAEVLTPADAAGMGGKVRLRLLDPRKNAEVRLDGVDHPLTADFSAPYALQLTRNNLDKDKLSNLLRPGKMEGKRGVYYMEPLDKNKIPLLMVHGLMSSTLTWRQMTNDLWADPDIRARYQIWHYSYPTGMPYFYSAKAFRDDVNAALADAKATVGKSLPKMVVVAHSLGGLLTKSMVGKVDHCLWDATFDCPIDKLDLSPEDKATLHDSFMPKRDPRIGRVVFIAVPHHGSDLARKFIGRVGVGLMRLPADFLTYYARVIGKNYDHVQPDARAFFSKTGVTSIQDMSDRNPILLAFATIPMGDVPFHTILGSISSTFPTDGVVPVKSGQLAGAQSELIVPGFGHMVNTTPEAIAEVRRILHEHR